MKNGYGWLLAVALATFSATTALAYIEGDGKGKVEADCLVGLEGYVPDDQSPFGKKGKPAIQCTDCDPACDLDGDDEANGSCTFSIAVRVNDGSDDACTPAALKKVTAKAKTKGTKIDFKTSFQPPLDGSSATSAFVSFPVLLKKFGTPKVKAGTGKVSLSAKKLDKPKLSDKDKFVFVCNPRPEGEACPVPSTTSTTLETTTTSVTSTTTTTTTLETTTTSVTSTTTTTLETTTTSVTSTTTTTTTLETTTTSVTSTTTTTLETTTTSVTSTTTTTIGPICGDGVVNQPGEECDGSDLNGATCPGSAMGAFPACTGGCLLDFTPCEGGSTTSTTTTTIATTSTTVSTTSSTTTSSTTTSSTTTTVVGVVAFTTGPAGGSCGVAKTGGASGTTIKTLQCGGLNIGGGGSTVPEGPTPAGAPTRFNASCSGTDCTLTARTAAQDGGNNSCTDTGCNFGTFLSIANGGLSTCVHNTFASPGSGTLDTATGAFSGSVPLSSAVNVTGNAANPCPSCVADTCDSTATNSGASCTAVNVSGDTYDCLPGGTALAPFGVDLTPLSSGQESKSGPTFCPSQQTAGCFGNGTCDYIEENGSPATGITPGGGPVSATLVSVFCIPAAGNILIDGAADLPGPGATALPGMLDFEVSL